MVGKCGLRESLMTKAIPPPFVPDPPADLGKERSAILATSPAGRIQVSVSSMMSKLLSSMKVDISDLFLADKECVFG